MDVEWIEVEADTTVEAVADAVEVAWARMGAGKVQRDRQSRPDGRAGVADWGLITRR